ncbi:MAG: calcium-binding protein, partial [Planctomycetota bacterium]
MITPVVVGGQTMDGVDGDGDDQLTGGIGSDIIFGGAGVDQIDAGDGHDYVDAGAGAETLDGGEGNDILRGGANDDVVRGGPGIDQIYGDLGDDTLFGQTGDADGNQSGQRLFGGAGRDELFAYAPTTGLNEDQEPSKAGDQLFGGVGDDFLRGNIRQEVLVGDSGNDFVHGDILLGPELLENIAAATTGANDILQGGGGDDQLYGGGGNDEIWGGPGTDTIEGQTGSDKQFGGGGIDLFYLWTGDGAHLETDTIDGHYGNQTLGDTADDNATDILVVAGTNSDDTILFSQHGQGHPNHGQGRIDFNDATYTVDFLDSDGVPLVEQFQAAGLGGNDTIGFTMLNPPQGLMDFKVPGNAVPLNLDPLRERSNDFVGVFDGNSGDDLLVGGGARDRLDGGSGSDVIYGFAGDDRLWGDGGGGIASDHDRLFAGLGNDDLVGGQGTNQLYAWSMDPQLGQQFGIFVGSDGSLHGDSGDFSGGQDENGNDLPDGKLDEDPTQPARELETTGLNRILGSAGNDELYGGTTVDFMYGNGGDDHLYRADGTTFESLGDDLGGDDAWKEYARESDQVWYIGGTNAADEIHVDFVTEPGLLSDHHLITRLTENNGNFSFAASVRLDFGATDAEGNLVWDATDSLIDANAYSARVDVLNAAGTMSDEDLAKLQSQIDVAETALVDGLLPGEGDFLVILIDALDGNDEVTVGPTVQKTVWIDGGAGDDRIEIRGGNAILIDAAEKSRSENGFRVRNDLAETAYNLDKAKDGATYTGLTIDNPNDVDWYAFDLSSSLDSLRVTGASPADQLSARIYPASRSIDSSVGSVRTISGTQSLEIDLAELRESEGVGTYLLELRTDQTPTIYDLAFLVGQNVNPLIEMSLREDFVRRDVILGGLGNDVLRGGPGEDWIFGGPGQDVLSGGYDRNASDLLFAG